MVLGAALASGALVALGLVSIARRRTKRGPRREAAIGRGLRRGAMTGSVVALVGILRVVDGLTPLTAVFVVAPFIVAEAVLSTRRA